ncbi:MAG TPA: SRPBCC family protein [Candidatus Limnocylindrales bacterium]|nr:SRPBCC family protein [Candidatus Limnocylindrales bacterium]
MNLEHSFSVAADPDETYAFLLDVNRVAACMPGMSSVEAESESAFLGTLKVKVGPVGVTYRGRATITDRDDAARTAVIYAEGTEGAGAGGVRATARMSVSPEAGGSRVSIATDLAIAGRLAQFGRGIIDGVAKRMVGQMADCIRVKLEAS